ncbi:MAG: hypothetical protein U5K53_08600 [Halanaerobiales bacterium]|nr:hypothetical protein [Halanaerobiales bacterium]
MSVSIGNNNGESDSNSKIITIAGPPNKTIDSNSVVIGEKITNRINIPLKSGNLGDLTITEALASGIALDSFQINADNNSDINYTVDSQPSFGDNGTLSWNLSSVQNNSSDNSVDNLVLEYKAFIKDETTNQSGDTFLSVASVNYNNSLTLNTNSTSITLKEPEIEITKTLNTTGPYVSRR